MSAPSDPHAAPRWTLPLLAGLALAVGARVWIASSWGLLADEAYHWRWSDALAWGYFDQPPLIAWVLALARALWGDSPLALRLLPLSAGLGGALALLPFARDRSLWLLWALGLPPLWLMTQLAVPDALLIGAWAASLACALAGGRGWIAAGLFAGLAGLAKPTGWLLMPLLLGGAGAQRRTAWPWIGAGLALALIGPNLLWNAGHDWVMLRFQVGEGLLHPRPPGAWGPLRQVVESGLFATPFAAAAAWAWWASTCAALPTVDRIDRLCLWASAPVAVGFALAAVGGPPEAHWVAPAWLGAGLGLSRSTGRLLRLAWLGAWLGAFASVALAVHAWLPLAPLRPDPGTRLTEGALLAEAVGRWALPLGISAGEAGAAQGTPVLTERYQEAALIRYHTGLPAWVLPGCGRANQDDLWPVALPEHAFFVRPARSGPPDCALARYSEASGPHPLRAIDAVGRPVGPWQLFELRR